MAILISCETSGELLPEDCVAEHIASGQNAANQTVDLIGIEMSQRVSDRLGMPLVRNPYRQDLIDVTRSLRHPKLWGDSSSALCVETKKELIERAYMSYYDSIRVAVADILQEFTFAVHLSIRTFSPDFGGKRQRTDVGLLYDPNRIDEVDFCLDWIDEHYDINPNVRMRRNYPRRGTANHLHRVIRKQFPADQYLGIEVWLNRAWAARSVRLRDEAIESLCESLRVTIGLPTMQASCSDNRGSSQEVA